MDQDRPFELRLRLELREKAVHVVDVPWSLDLRDHDHVELVPDLGDDLGQVVEHPRRLERVDARPELRLAKLHLAADLDQAIARRHLPVHGDRVLEVAEQDVDGRRDVGDLRDHLLVREVEEVDHPRGLEGDLADRLRRLDRKRLEEISGASHRARQATEPYRYCARPSWERLKKKNTLSIRTRRRARPAARASTGA